MKKINIDYLVKDLDKYVIGKNNNFIETLMDKEEKKNIITIFSNLKDKTTDGLLTY